MISELRTFVAIVRHGTFAQAAVKVGLTQAAVSAQIKRLEEHFGVVLFDRTRRSARLNAAGARILPRAQAVISQFDSIADPETDGTTGRLRIGAIGSVQSALLSRALLSFRQRYPKYGVHVIPGESAHLADQVDSGELDLAILLRSLSEIPPEIVWHMLRREPYVLIAHSSCAGDNWRELLQSQPFIRYHRMSFGGRQVDRFLRSLPFVVSEAAEAPLPSMVSMVENRLGVALVPISAAFFPLPHGVRAFPLEDQNLFREIGMIVSRNVEPHSAVSHLAECLITSALTEPSLPPV